MLLNWKLVISLAAGLAAAGTQTAMAADECPPLTMVTSVEMHIGQDGRVYVPATIGDKQKYMLVDTGGGFTEITQAAQNELQLNTHHADVGLVGISGDVTYLVAHGAFTLGNLHSNGMDFLVSPGEDELDSSNPDAAGVLAPNLLRTYDLDFDFAGKKVNLLSQNHCDGKVVYWPADAVAVVPIHVNTDGHVIVPVTLDGHKLSALLDTGSDVSVLNLEEATSTFGLTPGAADTPAVGHLSDEAHSVVYRHTFKTLSLEGLTIANPKMDILPNLMKGKTAAPNSTISNGTRLNVQDEAQGLNDMILGMNVISHLHLYIAYKEGKLYITPAASSAAATPAASP